MATALLTPIDRSDATPDASNPRRFRKQILPLTTITYEGKEHTFDESWMRDLITSFKDGAHHQVPFQLADKDNGHTNDVERTGGDLIDLELTNEGLVGIFDLNDRGLEVIKNNPKLGVSARMLLDHERSTDRKVFPRSLQHVLGTVDPKVPHTSPWQAVNLSQDGVTETIDLSAEELPRESEDKMGKTAIPPAPGTKKPDEAAKVTLELSAEEAELFKQVLADQKLVVELANGAGGEEGGATEPQEVVLSAQHAAAIELAKADAETAKSQALELTNQLRQAEVGREIDKYRATGLAPAIIDLARPALELPAQVIELSSGTKVDPGKVVRDVLDQVIALARTGDDMIDLDVESGVMVGSDSVQESRAAKLAGWSSEYGD